jgi:large subunit ribosomal protein L17
MRHAKHTFKLGRTGTHNRCMIANMLKDLIDKGRIQTSPAKAKELRRHADHLITLAKEDTLAARREARAYMKLSFNPLTPKEKREVKKGAMASLNTDRKVLKKLFGELKDRFMTRQGGYTRIIRLDAHQRGDNAPMCLIEYLAE